MYESDITKFMREFLREHPEEIASQKKGRAIWWDKDAKERTAPPEAAHAPKSGGAEHTFKPEPSAPLVEKPFRESPAK